MTVRRCRIQTGPESVGLQWNGATPLPTEEGGGGSARKVAKRRLDAAPTACHSLGTRCRAAYQMATPVYEEGSDDMTISRQRPVLSEDAGRTVNRGHGTRTTSRTSIASGTGLPAR